MNVGRFLRPLTIAGGLLLLGSGFSHADAPMNERQVESFARAYTAAWNSLDPAQVASFYAEDGSLTINQGTPSIGRLAIGAAAEEFMVAFPDLVLEFDGLEFEDDRVNYHWTFIGTNTGPGGTGNAVNFSGYESWDFDADGLIDNSLGHFDENEYQRQLENGADAE